MLRLSCVIVFMFAFHVWAQGGPPLITDDPFTPGADRWEINIAAQLTRTSTSRSYQLPSLDLNYGYGDNVQLNFVTTGTSFGVKWRFFGDEKAPLAVSTYPRLDSDVGGENKRYFLPIEFAFKVGALALNPEIGYAYSTRDPGEWDYGLALGYEFVEGVEGLAEVHARAPVGEDLELLPQIGMRYTMARWLVWLTAVGATVRETAHEAEFLNVYVGAQLLL